MELPSSDAIRPPRRPAARRGPASSAATTTSHPTGSGGSGATPTAPSPPPPLGHQRWWRRHWKRLALIVGILVVAGGAGGAWAYTHRTKPHVAAAVVPKKKPVPPAPIYSPLTGLKVASADIAKQPVVGVMIENLYPNARPQSGLGQAGVVYEALAEGGITRFLAVFQEPLPTSIGPVRSLRPYYLDWGLEYGIPVAHAGGSQPAIAAIPRLGLRDINALLYDGSYFYRTTDRYAPHNLYTDNQKLSALVAKLNYANAPTFQPLPRKADKAVTPAPHPTIRIAFSSSPYAVEYDFNAATDSYNRFMGGAPHVDRNSNTQIQVKNVVVEYVPTSYSTQPDGKPETDLHIVGSGQAVVLTDGSATTGTWNKSADNAPTQLLDTTGKPVPLNRGNTWYEVVPVGNSVTY